MSRLNHLPTLRIHPEKKTTISYKGKSWEGVAGDSVATLLYANGVRIFSRSLKYHRPRGLYSLDGVCSNTTMAVDGIPNVRMETLPAANGMTVTTQNVMGKSADRDWMAFIDKLGWAMPAGFYYRTMHKPAWIWPQSIPRIRKMAGLGVMAPDFEMRGVFDEIYPRAEVCVIGGGPAGMQSALAAAGQGLRVILLEDRPWLGGCFEHRSTPGADGTPLYQRARDLAARVEAEKNIRIFTHTAMVGIYTNNMITAFQRGCENTSFTERYLEIRADSVVVATGCIERPLLFEHNERPGVMQPGCAHRLARTYGILPGKSAVFSVGHDLGLEAAADLYDLGVKILCVADTREGGQAPELTDALEQRCIPLLRGWTAAQALGSPILTGVTLSPINGSSTRHFVCDLLAASAGLTPVNGPLNLTHAKLRFDRHTGFFLATNLPAKVHAAGSLLGLWNPGAIEASGTLAGLKAAADCGTSLDGPIQKARKAIDALPGPERGSKFVSVPCRKNKAFICFDEDVTLKHVDQAIQMGFDMPELIKRFTSAGTGPGQGGIPGHNLPMYVSQAGPSSASTPSPTTVRAPLVPTFMATYAGAKHHMAKRTPVHNAQVTAGGRMELVGAWNRARYFSDDKTCQAEIEAVRGNVALLDASTLGKFRIFGPDALKALQRVYAGDMSKIADGKIKYAAMCNEDGCIIDDGVVVKRGENDYYLTTSTARAGTTVEWIRYHTRYDGWNFHMVNFTDTFGVINIAGPKALNVLEKITDADVSDKAFPFSGYREFSIGGRIPVRAMRLGFVGERSYELHIPASFMEAVWQQLEKAGAEYRIRNFGLEAQNVLRLEKGHLIIGSESEQRVNLIDVGLGFLWYRNKPEAKTVGSVALHQAENQPDRLKLVGFKMEDPTSRPPRDGSVIVDTRVRGYVCTARYSFALKEAVGMALVDAPLARVGTRLEIFEDDANDQRLYAKVVDMPFYDPQGKRMKSKARTRPLPGPCAEGYATDDLRRKSPVSFYVPPVKTEERDGWQVVLAYDGEAGGPWLIDLSHRSRWDLQDRKIDAFAPLKVTVPQSPGGCTITNGVVVSRMNRTQASVWHIGKQVVEAPPKGPAFTETTDSTVFLAIIGEAVFSITEKLSALDFLDPEKSAPFLVQGPFCHVPCQIVCAETKGDRKCLLLTCSRGYAHDVVHGILNAGKEFGLRPAGETRFHDWLEKL